MCLPYLENHTVFILYYVVTQWSSELILTILANTVTLA